MTDLRTLHDAFAELERRADAAGAPSTAPRPRRALGLRLVPVAATVVAVAGLAAGAMWLAPGDGGGTQAGSPPTTSSTTAPPTSESPVPTSPEDLATSFKRVLGDTATFRIKDTAGGPGKGTVPPPTSQTPERPVAGSVTTMTKIDETDQSPGAFINGVLTTKAGAKGGFDLQIYAGDPTAEATCADPDRSQCTTDTLPDGSKLAIGATRLEDPAGITYEANLVRPDGTVILMHISNQADPKGAGEIYAPEPPLTTDQLKAIVTSDRW